MGYNEPMIMWRRPRKPKTYVLNKIQTPFFFYLIPTLPHVYTMAPTASTTALVGEKLTRSHVGQIRRNKTVDMLAGGRE